MREGLGLALIPNVVKYLCRLPKPKSGMDSARGLVGS